MAAGNRPNPFQAFPGMAHEGSGTSKETTDGAGIAAIRLGCQTKRMDRKSSSRPEQSAGEPGGEAFGDGSRLYRQTTSSGGGLPQAPGRFGSAGGRSRSPAPAGLD